MNVLAAYSIKGGVGKTAFAVNFAHACAQAGKRTLLLDLDPQGASSFYFRVKPHAKLKGRKLIAGKQSLKEFVRESDYPGLDLLPAKLSFRHFDVVLADAAKPRRQLRALLKPLAKRYDMLILDAPPTLSLLSENILDAADTVVTPVVPTSLSANTLDQLVAFLDDSFPGRRPVLIPFFSMVERRKRLHRDMMCTLRTQHPEILHTTIPYSTDVERMGLARAPLLATRPRCPAGKAFAELAAEVMRGL
ncbi:MAG: ParA family protein [Victivallales bacterium]|jgi:chromosome partitioning protein|nr:ParA family protein [Victivallales bacterium]